jgi:hypothetical protein
LFLAHGGDRARLRDGRSRVLPEQPGHALTSEAKNASLYEFSDRAYKEGFALLPEFGAALDKE